MSEVSSIDNTNAPLRSALVCALIAWCACLAELIATLVPSWRNALAANAAPETMLMLSAPALIALGVALIGKRVDQRWPRAVDGCFAIALLIGVFLTGHAFTLHTPPGWAFEPDGTRRLLAARPGAVPGILFMVLAVAFLTRRKPRLSMLSKGLALFAGMSSLYVLAGYAYVGILGSRFQVQLATPFLISVALIALSHAAFRVAHGHTLLASNKLARLMLVASVILPMLGGWHLWRQAVQAADLSSRVAFERHVERVEQQIIGELARYERALRDASAAMAVAGEMSRDQWHDYVAALDLQATLPGVRGVGYAPIIKQADSAALIARMHTQGLPDFKIWSPSSATMPTLHAMLVPITHSEPADERNRRAIGFDLISEAVRERAVHCAMLRARPCASGKVKLVQETAQSVQPAFLLFIPVYHLPHASTEQRQEKYIMGIAYMAFRAWDLIDSMQHALDNEVLFQIYDGSTVSAGALMTRSTSLSKQKRALYTSTRTVTLFDQPWTFVFQSTPGFERAAMADLPNASRYGGVVIALLTFTLVSLLVMERSAALARSRQDMHKLQNLNTRLEAEIAARGATDAALRETGLRFKTVADASPLGLFVTDRHGHCQYTNHCYQAIAGLSLEETLGDGWSSSIHPDDAERVSCQWIQAAENGTSYRSEHRFLRADGAVVWTRVTAARMTDAEQVLGYVGIVEDITQTREQQQRIGDALAEKETLLREVYHRVKNNLQVIQSLLSLQRRTVPEGPVRSAIDDIVQRVRAMALVHEQLYQSTNLAAVSLHDYTRDLIKQIVESSGARQRHIDIHSDIALLSSGLDNAVPFGLLLNELISNCIKHGFPEGRTGDVWVTLTTAAEGTALLSVKDNGVGLPPGFQLDECRSMGLKLVGSLAKQLGGQIEVRTEPGLTIFQVHITRL